MNYLHPGLVTGFVQEDPEYVIVSTDDGDTRDVHFDQIRFLPNNFSTLGIINKETIPLPKSFTPTSYINMRDVFPRLPHLHTASIQYKSN